MPTAKPAFDTKSAKVVEAYYAERCDASRDLPGLRRCGPPRVTKLTVQADLV
jgi:hypothetical protein